MIDYLHKEFYFNKDGFHSITLQYLKQIKLIFPDISSKMTHGQWLSNIGLWLIYEKTSNSGNNWTLLRIITKKEDRGATEFPKAICKLLFYWSIRGQSKVISRPQSNPRWFRGHLSCHFWVIRNPLFHSELGFSILYLNSPKDVVLRSRDPWIKNYHWFLSWERLGDLMR